MFDTCRNTLVVGDRCKLHKRRNAFANTRCLLKVTGIGDMMCCPHPSIGANRDISSFQLFPALGNVLDVVT